MADAWHYVVSRPAVRLGYLATKQKIKGRRMTPVRQKKIRTLLRARPSGMTPIEIAAELDIHVANIRTSLRAMPDTYVDRWRLGKRGQFEKVWVAVPVPDDCPHPKDRVKWGVHHKKPKTQWVIVQQGAVH